MDKVLHDLFLDFVFIKTRGSQLSKWEYIYSCVNDEVLLDKLFHEFSIKYGIENTYSIIKDGIKNTYSN